VVGGRLASLGAGEGSALKNLGALNPYANLMTCLDLLYAAVVKLSVRGVDMDLLMILGTVCFFVIAISYTVACDKLK